MGVDAGRSSDPHRDQAVLAVGKPLEGATAAVILVHGRGATAESILELAALFDDPRFAYLAPQAAGNTWYPYSFLAPMDDNEPWLSSALAKVGSVIDQVKDAGISSERTILLGFSQGACLASEFAARNARRYGGVVALSGGLIGPPDTPRDYDGALDGTPALFGCSDVDQHIPVERVDESAEVYERLGAQVTKRIYPGMGHTVNEDEIEWVRDLVQSLASG